MSGIEFSPLIIGTMRLGVWGADMSAAELERFIDQCLALGLCDFDHADIYGGYTTETQFGAVLQRRPDLRQRLRLTTKCGIRLVSDNRPGHRIKSYDSSKAHVVASVDNSLRELHTDHIDLLLIHRPDYLMDVEEVADALAGLTTSGKVLHFGVSNFRPSQLELLHEVTSLVNHQVEISVTHLDAFDDGTLDQCQRLNIVPSAWSPLGGGAMFGHSDDPRLQRVRSTADELAQAHCASPDQILLAWLLRHPAGIVPVLGTAKIARVEAALSAVRIELSREDWYRLWSASTGDDVA